MKLSKKVPTYKHFSPAEERILLEFLFAFSELSLIVIKHHELDFTGYWNVSIPARCNSCHRKLLQERETCKANKDKKMAAAQQGAASGETESPSGSGSGKQKRAPPAATVTSSSGGPFLPPDLFKGSQVAYIPILFPPNSISQQ